MGDNTWLLSTRLRGQLGSDAWVPALWPAGSYFVRLDGIPEQIDLKEAQRNIARHYRIGPARRGYDDPSYRHEVQAFEGVGLRPLSPIHLRAEADPEGNLTLGWIRRTRIGGDAWEGLDVPLGEESEAYLLRVVQGGSVLREVALTAPLWIYPAPLKVADLAPGVFEIHVAQVSALFGVGAWAKVTLSS